MASSTRNKRKNAARRKAEQRARQRQQGLESVSLTAPTKVLATLRAAAPFHPKKTFEAVVCDALEAYAANTHKGTRDLAAVATEFWPKIRPLLPYLRILSRPGAQPIRVYNRLVTAADVAPLLPVHDTLMNKVQSLGHSDYVSYLDVLVGLKK